MSFLSITCHCLESITYVASVNDYLPLPWINYACCVCQSLLAIALNQLHMLLLSIITCLVFTFLITHACLINHYLPWICYHSLFLTFLLSFLTLSGLWIQQRHSFTFFLPFLVTLAQRMDSAMLTLSFFLSQLTRPMDTATGRPLPRHRWFSKTNNEVELIVIVLTTRTSRER